VPPAFGLSALPAEVMEMTKPMRSQDFPAGGNLFYQSTFADEKKGPLILVKESLLNKISQR
jgi:hypothetical protein